MQETSVDISVLDAENEQFFWEMLGENRYFLDGKAYFDRCVERHNGKEVEIILALSGGQKVIGYTLLNLQPKYPLFKSLGLPEIQDLNVLVSFRRQGIGGSIIDFCENRVIDRGYDSMGIGVGLDASFGVAQRLYVKKGYIPDGNGICYDRKQVTVGEFRPVDGNLCLMMVKDL